MNPRLMYGFLAGFLLLLVGFSLLQNNRAETGETPRIVGLIALAIGGLLVVGSLVLQARRRRDEDREV